MKFSWVCGSILLNNSSKGLFNPVLIVILLILASCSSHPLGPPKDGILKSDRFVELLIDIHFVDGIYENSFDVLNYIESIERDSVDMYGQVLERHSVDRELFLKTMKYYSHNPSQFEQIYNKVVDELNRMLIDTEMEIERPGGMVPGDL